MANVHHGKAVRDVDDASALSTDQDQFRRNFSIDQSKQIKLVKLVHMRYQHPQLDEITTFLEDFGMTVAKRTDTKVWYKGYGEDPYVYYAQKGEKKFLGGCFEVESVEELEKASRLLPNASPIQDLDDSPGGGKMVTVYDPTGFPVNLIFGQQRHRSELPQPLQFNYEKHKPRIRQFQRFTPGPSPVHKLGHYGLCVRNFDEQFKFYIENFNLVPSDILYVTEGGKRKNVAVFAHVDRGDDYVDHHTFFMSGAEKDHVHHCSFEVHDYDTQNLGHYWLASKGYKPVWGVGRHILGSQLFDYWWDTTGNMIEHYTDGDLVNKHSPVDYCPAGPDSLYVWGPKVPSTFLD
uniref:ARAD1C00330p n=1 Tax=Blastobotrys adeninivorans TaxID=409370 RepID=A0A060SYV9_BLAAD